MAPALPSAPWTDWQVNAMSEFKIQQIFQHGWDAYFEQAHPGPDKVKAARAILDCKSGRLGCNLSICSSCGHTEVHNNSCRNRNCPGCQAVLKEVWVDKRRAEVIDAPYYHVVFTLPHELNGLLYCNQKLLYSLFHRCSAETLLELSRDRKYLGATPGIIQVLHTWGQELNYHVHLHCIISGGGLSADGKLRRSQKQFFLPVRVMRDLFKGKFLSALQSYYASGQLSFSSSCEEMRNPYEWQAFRELLYKKDWCPYIKETFNGFGNAIEYLGRYTHRIAITNARIRSVSETHTTFAARDYRTGGMRDITLENTEFIRRFLMHVLPSGFQKIRYYGFLNNRSRKKNLKLIFKLQRFQKFRERYSGMTMAELLKAVWGCDVTVCTACGCGSMKPGGKTYANRN